MLTLIEMLRGLSLEQKGPSEGWHVDKRKRIKDQSANVDNIEEYGVDQG